MSKCYHFDKALQGGKTDKAEDNNVLMSCIPGTDSTPVYQEEMEWIKPLKLERICIDFKKIHIGSDSTFSSFSRSVVSDTLQSHESQHISGIIDYGLSMG